MDDFDYDTKADVVNAITAIPDLLKDIKSELKAIRDILSYAFGVALGLIIFLFITRIWAVLP